MPYDPKAHGRAFLEEAGRNIRAAPWVWPASLLLSLAATWFGLARGGYAVSFAIAPWAAYLILIGAVVLIAYEKSHRA